MFGDCPISSLSSAQRDGVRGLDAEDPPTIVSVSDIHGYIQPARSALLTLADHPNFDAVVRGGPGPLEWAGGDDYVLVFNGDLFDRGPDNDAVAEMVTRLARQAPDGHVRVTLGNHEMGILTPGRFGWDGWYSTGRSDDERAAFLDCIRDGFVVAAYEGHNLDYAHAGRPEPYDPSDLNDDLTEAAQRLAEAVGTDDDLETQQAVIEDHPEVLGLGGRTGRGPGAGIAWLDLAFMPEDAPPQVVGHTRQDYPRRKGAVLCENTIRNTKHRDGGESVVVETTDRLVALSREPGGGVRCYEFSVPDRVRT